MEPPKDTFGDAVVNIKEELDQYAEVVPKISCNALYGFISPQSMKVQGYFKGQLLIILLDLGSTHNFIELDVAKKTHSYIYPHNNFEAMSGNGGKIACKG